MRTKVLITFSLVLILLLPGLLALPSFAQVIFSDGFESGNESAWNRGKVVSDTAALTFVNSPVHHGNWAMECQTLTNTYGWAVVYAKWLGYATLYFRAYVQLTALPANVGDELDMVELESSDEFVIATLGVGFSGGVPKWQLYYMKGGGYSTLYAGTPTINEWHCLELMATVDAANGEVKAYVDGTEIMSDSGFENDFHGQATLPVLGFDSWSGNNYINTGYFDCAVVSDQYIGPESGAVYSLTTSVVGSGSVDRNNSGPYHYGDVVQLTAVPSTGWGFDYWSGNFTSSTNPFSVTITGDTDVTATFTQNVYTLTISTDGSGSVSTDKPAPYHYGDVVQLTATPAADWSFQYWTGDLSGSANVTTITMTADHSVTAHFINKPTLQMSPTSKTCRTYHENFVVTITVSNAANVASFNLEIHYDTTLLDYVGVAWNVWGTGTINIDEADGIITVSNSGTPTISGTQTLVTITFTASIHHIWKSGTGYTNDLTGTIYFQTITIGYPSGPPLQYSRGDSTQINVGPDFAYTFSPIQGDLNNDGAVDITDLRTVAAYYDKTQADPEWPEASKYDLNRDNTIDIFDLVIAASNFGFTYP